MNIIQFYVHTENFKSVKTSGIFSAGGGLGFTIGTQQTKTTQGSDGVTRQGTNIAALGGNVSISAGENAHISSSNILADKDATVTAKETYLDGKDNIYRESITQESKTTGLTVNFSHGLLDLGQSLYTPLSRMGEVQDDRLKAVYAWQTGRMIHDAFKKNPLTGKTFSLDISFGTSKSYSRMENTTTEYAGSRIASGRNTNITAGERALTVTGSAVTGNNVSLSAKGNVRLEAGENTSITTTENKFSAASIGASFAPSGLTDISISADKANGDSKESVTSYSPALVSAKNTLSLTSGKDMDIIGSKAQGEKITAQVGGNLNIETLQEKETYEEDNHSTGFGVSWNVNQTKKETTDANGDTKIKTLRSFSKPTFSASWNKGNIDSHYRSARDQAGFFAGSKGFDIYVEKNTDLMGGIIASKASADKNRLSTGTLSFSDLKNEADYSAKSIGASYHKYGNYKNMTEDEQNKVYNTIGLAPNLSMPVKGDASSTTKSAVAAGTIDIRDNPTQDISALSRDTANSLNELGKIFDKAKIEEQQELAAVFGEEAFRLAHNLKDDGSGRKIAIHIAIGGIMSAITGAGFASGAVGAGLNEALIKNLKGLDPGTAQIVSGIIGAAAAKVVGGNVLAGASAAASGTKWNYFLMSRPKEFGISELAKNILRKKDGRELSEEEVDAFLRESNNILSDMEPDLGLDKENPFAEDINNYQKVIRYLEIHGVAKDSAMRFFTAYNETVRNRDWTGVYNKPGSIDVIWDSKKNKLVDVRPPIPVYNPFDTRTYQEGQIIGSGASSGTQKVEGNNNPLETGTSQGHSVGSPTKYPSKENTTFSTEHEAKGSPSTTTRPSQENKRDKANDQSKAALGKTVAIETFKAAADIPVTLYNKYHDNPVKALKIGIFAPLGFGYDMYQDYGKYSGTDLAKVTLINSGAFAFSSVADAWLIGSAGMSVEATIVTNTIIVETADKLKKIWARSDEEKRRELP